MEYKSRLSLSSNALMESLSAISKLEVVIRGLSAVVLSLLFRRLDSNWGRYSAVSPSSACGYGYFQPGRGHCVIRSQVEFRLSLPREKDHFNRGFLLILGIVALLSAVSADYWRYRR